MGKAGAMTFNEAIPRSRSPNFLSQQSAPPAVFAFPASDYLSPSVRSPLPFAATYFRRMRGTDPLAVRYASPTISHTW